MTDPFAELPFFRHLSAATRAQFAAACMTTQYEAGAIVFRAGDMARGLYWLHDGAAELLDGETKQHVLPGATLGSAALIGEKRERATLTITAPARVSLLTRESFAAILIQAESEEAQALAALNAWAVAANHENAPLFPGQRPDEHVLLLRRRHLWALCRKLWMPGAVIALTLAGSALLPFGLGTLILLFGSTVLTLMMLIYQTLEWWNDLLIVSNQRVINIVRTLSGLRTLVTEAALRNIQQVSADFPRGDPLARMLNYGTIELRTTGDAGSIRLRDMREPRTLQQEIMAHCSLETSSAVSNGAAEDASAFWQNELSALVGEIIGPTQTADDQSVIGEERVYRKHVLVWLAHIWLGALVCLAGLSLLTLWPVWSPLRSLGGVGLALAACVTVVGGLWVYLMDWDWRHDLLILGENTITLHHRRPLWLQSERDEILLERVDNVTSSCVGILQTLWNFGEIRLALMGDDLGDVKRFRGVPQPQQVQQEISRRREELQRQLEARAQEAQRAAMTEALAEMTADLPAFPQPMTVPMTPIASKIAMSAPAMAWSPAREEELPSPPPTRPDTLPEDS